MTTAHLSPTPEVLARCEALSVLTAPEMKRGPLYFTGLPADYPSPGPNVSAFTSIGAMDFTIRDMLIAEGRWTGPGSMITFCQPMSLENALGIALHEVAHLLPFKASPVIDFEPTPNIKTKQREMVAASLNGPIGKSPTLPAWYEHHGLAFIRRCVHLHHRAWQHGQEVGLPEIQFAGAHYDLSPAWRYMRALGDRRLLPKFLQRHAVEIGSVAYQAAALGPA